MADPWLDWAQFNNQQAQQQAQIQQAQMQQAQMQQQQMQQAQMQQQQMQRARQQEDAAKRTEDAGQAGFLEYMKNPAMTAGEIAPVQPEAPKTAPGSRMGKYGPDVAPIAYTKAPEMAPMTLETVSKSLLKNPALANDPAAFSAALEKFQPRFEAEDKLKAEKLKSMVADNSIEGQILRNSMAQGKTFDQAIEAAKAYKRASPEEVGAVALEKGRSKTVVGREAGLSKAQTALAGFKQSSGIVSSNIQKAIDIISPFSAGYGSFLGVLPNTDAGALKGYLTTIQANLGFDKLQSMKESSPTGGALGQVSDFENRLLQAVSGALDPAQSKLLLENLKVIQELYPKVLAEKERAFNQDYGSIGGQQNAGGIDKSNPQVQAALAAGYSEKEIADHLGAQ